MHKIDWNSPKFLAVITLVIAFVTSLTIANWLNRPADLSASLPVRPLSDFDELSPDTPEAVVTLPTPESSKQDSLPTKKQTQATPIQAAKKMNTGGAQTWESVPQGVPESAAKNVPSAIETEGTAQPSQVAETDFVFEDMPAFPNQPDAKQVQANRQVPNQASSEPRTPSELAPLGSQVAATARSSTQELSMTNQEPVPSARAPESSDLSAFSPLPDELNFFRPAKRLASRPNSNRTIAAQSELAQSNPPQSNANSAENSDAVQNSNAVQLTYFDSNRTGSPNPDVFDSNIQLTGSLEPTQPESPETSPEPFTLTPGSAGEDELPHVLQGSKNFKLAEQPAFGEHFKDDRPIVGQGAVLLDPLKSDFSPDPAYNGLAYFGESQQQVYAGKKLYANQRPLVELGRPWYQLGQLSPGYNWFGQHNNIAPQFIIYGDYRSTIASNKANGNSESLIASELNLDIDLKLTGTERFHAFVSPLDDGLRNTRYLLDEDRAVGELDANFDFGYFEGDLGAMAGGFLGETLPFDMPFAVGVMPLLFQNGVWMEDAFLGVAATIPARNSARFNISNMDITFFAGYDKISSDAFSGDDSAARMYGMASFIEAMNGYFEIDYAFLDDRTFDDRSYHNIGLAFSRRYGRLISNSTRVIINAGQSNQHVPNTADGVLLLSENSLITGAPSSMVPYFNLFAGFDRPQSAARAVQAGGILRNTGILFESDGMTNYPTLDPTANDTYGGAFGLNIIADDFSQQLVLEMAMLGVMGNDATRNAPGEQIGLGFRYQLPLTNSIIFRADGMYGFLDDQPDVRGLRFELRQKW